MFFLVFWVSFLLPTLHDQGGRRPAGGGPARRGRDGPAARRPLGPLHEGVGGADGAGEAQGGRRGATALQHVRPHQQDLQPVLLPQSPQGKKKIDIVEFFPKNISALKNAVFRIRIHWLWMRFQYFRRNTDPDPGF
jgi:hypothetical protein